MRRHWVFFEPCGCAFGLTEDRGHTRAQAWKDFYDEGTKAATERAIGKAVAAGVTTELVDHATYVAELMPQLRSDWTCPHAAVPA
jgi:hypothetical protein